MSNAFEFGENPDIQTELRLVDSARAEPIVQPAVLATVIEVEPVPLPAQQERTANLSENILADYLNQLRSIPLLSKEEEVALAQAVEKGRAARQRLGVPLYAEKREMDVNEARQTNQEIKEADAAREQLAQANLRLVVSVVKKYVGRGLDMEDLIQEGNLGLLRAIDKFDWQKGFRFDTYATWWIQQFVVRGVINKGKMIHLPDLKAQRVNRYINAQSFFLSRNVEPTREALADYLNWPVETVDKIRRYYSFGIVEYLDQPLSDEADANCFGDMISDANSAKGFKEVERDIDLRSTVLEVIDDLLTPHKCRASKSLLRACNQATYDSTGS